MSSLIFFYGQLIFVNQEVDVFAIYFGKNIYFLIP